MLEVKASGERFNVGGGLDVALKEEFVVRLEEALVLLKEEVVPWWFW